MVWLGFEPRVTGAMVAAITDPIGSCWVFYKDHKARNKNEERLNVFDHVKPKWIIVI